VLAALSGIVVAVGVVVHLGSSELLVDGSPEAHGAAIRRCDFFQPERS
jgi:hypothetical protein